MISPSWAGLACHRWSVFVLSASASRHHLFFKLKDQEDRSASLCSLRGIPLCVQQSTAVRYFKICHDCHLAYLALFTHPILIQRRDFPLRSSFVGHPLTSMVSPLSISCSRTLSPQVFCFSPFPGVLFWLFPFYRARQMHRESQRQGE